VTYGIFDACLKNHGAARISKSITETLQKAARVLNIAWIEDALELPARIICPRSTRCPRGEHCSGGQVRARAITDLRREVLGGRIPLHEAD
jgi:hypothetical protein